MRYLFYILIWSVAMVIYPSAASAQLNPDSVWVQIRFGNISQFKLVHPDSLGITLFDVDSTTKYHTAGIGAAGRGISKLRNQSGTGKAIIDPIDRWVDKWISKPEYEGGEL